LLRRLQSSAAPLVMAAALLLAAGASARAAVSVRAGEHEGFTRLVFDFDHTTAYRVKNAEGRITLTFATPEKLSLPGTDEKLINGFHASRTGAEGLSLVIDVPKGVTTKDYRLDEKIVLDIYAPQAGAPKAEAPKAVEPAAKATPKPAPAARAEDAPVSLVPEKPKAVLPRTAAAKAAPETAKPASSSPKPSESVPVTTGTATTARTPEQTPKQMPEQAVAQPNTQAAQTATPAAKEPGIAALAGAAGMNNSAIIVDQAPENAAPYSAAARAAAHLAVQQLSGKGDAQPQETQETQEATAAPTVVTLSTLEPSRLAVFKRFRTLWIVMDSETAGALAPEVSGPEAGLMGAAKPLKFRGGMAYRYLLPPHRNISVEKQGLVWRVSLSARPAQPGTETHLTVDFDKSSNRARLMAQLEGSGNVMQVPDPEVGDTLDVIAAGDQSSRIDETRRFVDVAILPAAIGMVIRPLADDIKVNKIDDYVLISSPHGITATPGAVSGPMAISLHDTATRNDARLFDFPNWRQGGLMELDRNVQTLENKIAASQTQDERTTLLMKMALLYFANNFGQETLGVLRLIEQEDENLPKNANFIALRGAAETLAGHYDEAIADLSNPAIQNHPEIGMWIGYAAAATGRWHMAERDFPADNYLLLEYPPDIAVPFTIDMAESALRLGHLDTANKLLASLETLKQSVDSHYEAAIDYLKGEAARQAGNEKLAMALWTPVSLGLDRLYHAKATLALASLELQEKKITLKQAIDEIDNLRFAWRGDGLEVQILHSLGKLKVQDGQFLNGLQDMQTAANLSADLHDDPQPIYDDMTNALTDLFVNGRVKEISPLEAVSVYNAYGNRLPQGETGSIAALNFADSLIGMDLLDKAEALLEAQLESGLVPPEKTSALGGKLAAVYLLDGNPKQALAALDKTAQAPAAAEGAGKRALLKARAQSQLGQTDAAIASLAAVDTDAAKRLKADVLWHAKRWAPAAQAIEALLPAPGKTLDDAQAQLVVNAAVAYKLAGDAQGIASLRDKYASAMEATTLGSTFGVVTRNGGGSALSDRGTILKIAGEVDMFKGFLDSYKARAKTAPPATP
jgi:hypothetical protein